MSYIPGDNKVECPRCGLVVRRSRCRQEKHTNSIVCNECWDPDPKDLYKERPRNESGKIPGAKQESTDTFYDMETGAVSTSTVISTTNPGTGAAVSSDTKPTYVNPTDNGFEDL